MITSDPGKYIRPDYSELPIDSDPDDDFDSDFDDDDEALAEEYIEEQENKKHMQTTPFGTPVNNNNTFGGNTGSNSPWQQHPSSQPSFGTGPWSKPATGSIWGNPNPSGGSTWFSGNNNNKRQEIDRTKQFIICDVLDCLVETYQSSGKPGLLPRGIYDIVPKFDVWQKLSCFNPVKIYAVVPRSLILSSNGSPGWKVLFEYICCSLSEYIRLPYNSVQIIVQSYIGQSKEDIIKSIISELPKDKVLQIGLQSGLPGQSNSDLLISEKLGISYLDLNQLMTQYY